MLVLPAASISAVGFATLPPISWEWIATGGFAQNGVGSTSIAISTMPSIGTASAERLANEFLCAAPTPTAAAAAASDTFFQAHLPLSSLVLSSLDFSQQELPGNIPTLDDLGEFLTTTAAKVSEILASTDPNDFETLSPLAILSTLALVTASDMVPFVPCQPLAISLGARYGPWAFPLCVAGQTLAGVLAFCSSRRISDAEQLQNVLESLSPDGKAEFQRFRTDRLLGSSDGKADERTVLAALVGLRLAPFFPFSAGNYLLGGATDVGLRPFVLATVLGCTFSNAVSVLVGTGGAELWKTINP